MLHIACQYIHHHIRIHIHIRTAFPFRTLILLVPPAVISRTATTVTFRGGVRTTATAVFVPTSRLVYRTHTHMRTPPRVGGDTRQRFRRGRRHHGDEHAGSLPAWMVWGRAKTAVGMGGPGNVFSGVRARDSSTEIAPKAVGTMPAGRRAILAPQILVCCTDLSVIVHAKKEILQQPGEQPKFVRIAL